MNFKNFKKRAASMCLVALLIAGVLPIQALGAEDDGDEDELPLNAVQFEVKLEINGGTATDSLAFTFNLEAVDGAPMPENTSITVQGADTGRFDPITYTEIGEYYYNISMGDSVPSRYSHDSTVYQVVVRVKYDNNADLVATYYAQTVSNVLNETTGLEEEVVTKQPEILFTSRYRPPYSGTPTTTNPDPEEEENDPLPEPTPTPTPEPEPTPTPEVTPAPTDTPKTGDSTNYLPWIILLCAVVVGIFCCVRYLMSLKRSGDRR